MFEGEKTDPGLIRIELDHLRERCNERVDRQDTVLTDHGKRIAALEMIAAKLTGAYIAVTIAAGAAAAAGSFVASWLGK